jgi:hypothetical protein
LQNVFLHFSIMQYFTSFTQDPFMEDIPGKVSSV